MDAFEISQRHRFPLQRGLKLSRIPWAREFSSRLNSRDLLTKYRKQFAKPGFLGILQINLFNLNHCNLS